MVVIKEISSSGEQINNTYPDSANPRYPIYKNINETSDRKHDNFNYNQPQRFIPTAFQQANANSKYNFQSPRNMNHSSSSKHPYTSSTKKSFPTRIQSDIPNTIHHHHQPPPNIFNDSVTTFSVDDDLPHVSNIRIPNIFMNPRQREDTNILFKYNNTEQPQLRQYPSIPVNNGFSNPSFPFTTSQQQPNPLLARAFCCACLFPLVAVFLTRGCSCDLLINILLTLLGWMPGCCHACVVVASEVYIEAEE